MELGIYTFADMTPDKVSGVRGAGKRLADLMEEIELADQAGLDVFAIGEHHRPDYAVSSPATVLAAAAVKTKSIRLSSAVTVLSSDDPVRVYQQFSTVDLLSNGRAEIMAGRGSFIESFPLFGYKLEDYDELFEEKLDLLLHINEHEVVNWKGKHHPSLVNQSVYPRPHQDKLPIWIAVGGTPQSVIRAAKLNVPIAFAIIGGDPRQFVQLVNLYRQTAVNAGHDAAKLQIGINSHGFVMPTSDQAADAFYPSYAESMSRIGRERGWPAMTRPQFDRMRESGGSLLVGDAQQAIDKILYEHELFGNTRYLLQMAVGAVKHTDMLKSIELFGSKVAPAVRKALA